MSDKVKRCGTATNESVFGSWDDVFRGVEGKASDYLYMGLHSSGTPQTMPEDPIPELLADGSGTFEEQDEPWPIVIVVPSGSTVDTVMFAHDLTKSMVNVGHGHDPYNHVGHDIVCAMLGV